ncbi:MAG: formylglycine-generating enzyme family protein [Xenococcus sp. MO_188.B8]|nr:formylglycine-generating enzyme family protein [Xenococcus sp. MO_188.B8]
MEPKDLEIVEISNIKIIKIFLASSSELKSDREQFEIFINRKNKEYIRKGIFLELVMWEDFLDAMSRTRLQDEYNKAIANCNVFVSLFLTKVGQYTEEEFEKALATFKANKRLLIYTYFKDSSISLSQVTSEINRLLDFKKKLSDLGHFYTNYADINDLKYKFSEQLNKIIPDNIQQEILSTPNVINDDLISIINSVPSPPGVGLKDFGFQVVTVNSRGEEVKRTQSQAQYFTEELGNGITLDMVAIAGGKFLMGTEDEEIERLVKKFGWSGLRREKPQHEVTVQPFFMGKYPVTQGQWKAVASLPKVKRDLEADPSKFKGGNRPVEQVSWEDAEEFCQRLSKQTRREYRLPTEAEWEYACRAGTTTPFHFGETITDKLANYNASQTYASESQGELRQKTTAVGIFSPNVFGLYDMHGNVWEWCEDDFHENYGGAPIDGIAWLSGFSSAKVMRGGSWSSYPLFCRSAIRYIPTRDDRSSRIGFRVVCVAPRTT